MPKRRCWSGAALLAARPHVPPAATEPAPFRDRYRSRRIGNTQRAGASCSRREVRFSVDQGMRPHDRSSRRRARIRDRPRRSAWHAPRQAPPLSSGCSSLRPSGSVDHLAAPNRHPEDLATGASCSNIPFGNRRPSRMTRQGSRRWQERRASSLSFPDFEVFYGRSSCSRTNVVARSATWGPAPATP
jgi:hypothetical protein